MKIDKWLLKLIEYFLKEIRVEEDPNSSYKIKKIQIKNTWKIPGERMIIKKQKVPVYSQNNNYS